MSSLFQIFVDSVTLTKFGISEEVNATRLPGTYNTITGNKPKTYENTIFVWQTGDWEVPEDDPKHSFTMRLDQASSTFAETVALAGSDYLVGYAVGNKRETVVTTQLLKFSDGKYTVTPPPAGEEDFHFSLDEVHPSMMLYSFRLLRGMEAKTNGDWVGVWSGSSKSSLYNPDKKPMSIKQVPVDDRSGSDVFDLTDGQQFVSGNSYLLGYFKTGFNKDKPEESLRTTLAAVAEFKGP
jgi:hypothetical protein